MAIRASASAGVPPVAEVAASRPRQFAPPDREDGRAVGRDSTASVDIGRRGEERVDGGDHGQTVRRSTARNTRRQLGHALEPRLADLAVGA